MNSLANLQPVAVNTPEQQSANQSANQLAGADTLQLGILNEFLGYHLRRAQSRMSQAIARQLEANQLTQGQMGLLIKIQNNPGISQTALARANGIERSTLGEIIERFERRQLIVRRRHPEDRRAYALTLSARGNALLAAVVPQVEAAEAALTATWSEEEKVTLLGLLKKLADSTTT